jgi:pimeloyl-ACP methyl ester carboxylesterase
VTTPILFVPGVLGTTLVDAAHPRRQLWGSAAGLIGLRRRPMTVDGPTGLEPGDVLWQFTVVPYVYAVPVYETLARRLERAGYRRASLAAPAHANGLYGLAYDWRQDIVTAARAIEAAVQQLRAALGIARVNIVAHSWGCNVVRYFLRYGGADVMSSSPEAPRSGAASVGTYFALGPLYGGTWRALHEAQHGFDVAPGLGVHARQASATACLYQLLPYASKDALGADGTTSEVDLSDVHVWTAKGWGPFQPHTLARLDPKAVEDRLREWLSRGRAVWNLLEESSPIDRQVRTITYSVTDQPTLWRLVIDRDGQPLASAEAVKRRAPALLPSVTAPGDQYVTIDQIRRHCDGTELVGVEGCTHRDLYKHEAVLSSVVRFAGAAA